MKYSKTHQFLAMV